MKMSNLCTQPHNPLKKYNLFLSMGVIGLLTLISFFPALSNDFIDFDDPAFLTENPLVKDFSWSNTVKIFKQIPIVIYVPLTILSFNLEYTFFGLNPFVYHLNNLILHILNSCLILCILYRLSGRDLFVSFCAALLFGIHPLRVESVAWVAERKDVLYGFFYLLSLLCYLYHLLSKKIGVFYLLSVLCFILALLSKPMAVTIVPALFLIDFMMNRSWKEKKVYFDKGLYLFFTIIFLIMTVMSQKRAGQYYGLIFPSLQTLMRASDIIVFYLTKLISPVDLCVLYDFSHKPGYYLGNIPSIPIIILLSGALIIISRKSKLITFGGLFFILHIAPLLHIVSMGSQIVSDHFTYVAAIGFFCVLGAWMAAAYRRLSKNRYLKILFILFFCTYFFCLILLTSTRCQVWRNSDSLWKDTLLKNPKAFLAYHNRGTQLLSSIDNLNKGKSKEQSDRARPGPDLVKEIPLIIEAMENFNEAIKINPRFAKSYYNRGILFNKLGLTKSALREYSIAIELNPKFVESYINRGVLYYSMGEHDKATSDYSKVLQLVPSHPKALKYRAAAYLALRDYDLALSDLESALSINPQDEEVRTKRDLVNYYKAHYNQG